LPNEEEQKNNIGESRMADACPYCQSKNFVKRGLRENRYQKVQLYLCRNEECARTFTAQDVKGKHFPLNVVIEAMSYYNLGFSLEETCRIITKKFSTTLPNLTGLNQEPPNFIAPTPATLSEWLKEYAELCRYERLRPYATKMCQPKDTIEVVSMAHRQLYHFRYHRPKTALILTEFGNRNLRRLQEYLNAVSSETPHQYFQEGQRMSEVRSKFSTADMIVRSKTNYANRLAKFVLQTVPENKARHEALQRFFIANDSCTVATEVPVYIRKEDVEHMQNILKFDILGEGGLVFKGDKGHAPNKSNLGSGRSGADIVCACGPSPKCARGNYSRPGNFGSGAPNPKRLPKLLTGHVDIIQIRNGQVHIMDYKPNAAKECPIEQLTWYALALSRLTGLRLFEFTCAWFDEKDYFQFFPLHVVKKIQTKAKKIRKRYVDFKDGTRVEVPRENRGKVVIA